MGRVSRSETIAAIRLRRAGLKLIGKLPRRRRPPPQLQPDAIRTAYFGALLEPLGRARELVREELEPALPALADEAARARGDGVRTDKDPGDVNAILDRISDRWFSEYPNERLARLAERYANRTATFQREQLSKQFKAVVGIDLYRSEPWLAPRVATFTAENVALIKSIASDHFGDLEKRLVAGLRTGQRWEDLATTIEERYGVAESRAKLVARDQVGKLFGELNRTRQKAHGVTGAIWRTMGDNRVRDSHVELEGERFTWEDPPTVDGEQVVPGEDVNCRCWAEPDFSTLEDDLAEVFGAQGPMPKGEPAPALPLPEVPMEAPLPVPALPRAGSWRTPPASELEMGERARAAAADVFGAEFTTPLNDVHWGQPTPWRTRAYRSGAGDIRFGADVTREVQGALRAARDGRELTAEHMAGLKTFFHEHVHSLGEWKKPVPSGPLPPGHAFAEIGTAIGTLLEEGATELTTITKYRDALTRLGFRAAAEGIGPTRSASTELHSYRLEVRALETVLRLAAGEPARENGTPLGAAARTLLDGVTFRWRADERVSRLARMMADHGPRESAAERRERAEIMEAYLRRRLPVRAGSETGYLDVRQDLETIRDARPGLEFQEVRRRLSL